MTGMSHGAAGYSYALAMLGDATGQDVFSAAARECIAFESTTYDAGTSDWADLRPSSDGRDGSPSKWCYGAPGIGLARAATIRHAPLDVETGLADVGRAVDAATRHWPVATDTLCCGTLGTVELLWEAGLVLHRPELGVDACRALRAVLDAASVGADYRWSNGTSRFNLGLFRGIAGVGYTALRRIDPGLPNVLVWE